MRDPKVRVLVVWEPELITDWAPPTTAVLSRLHEAGVLQFWDRGHLVAHEISHELLADPAGPKPECCGLHKNLWDFAGVYPESAAWNAAPPQAVFANGPVAYVQNRLSKELTSMAGPGH